MLLQKNPLTMVGTLDRCWLFTYQTPAADARRLLPRQLEPVTYGDYAFWNIVVSHIQAMRPKGVPAFVGISYWHVAYRLYVRFQPQIGAPIEGLYFVRSDCDNRLMSLAGNIVTDFNFHTAPIHVTTEGDTLNLRIASRDAPGHARLRPNEHAHLHPHSAFRSLEEAAAFLKYKPFGISIGAPGSANVVRITRDEAAWRSRIVPVESAHWAFFADKDVRPEICYEVEPIRYQWNRGRIFAGIGDQVLGSGI